MRGPNNSTRFVAAFIDGISLLHPPSLICGSTCFLTPLHSLDTIAAAARPHFLVRADQLNASQSFSTFVLYGMKAWLGLFEGCLFVGRHCYYRIYNAIIYYLVRFNIDHYIYCCDMWPNMIFRSGLRHWVPSRYASLGITRFLKENLLQLYFKLQGST